MGKIKDFFTKIGVADSDGEEGFQNTTADTKQADNSEKEEPVPQNGRNIHLDLQRTNTLQLWQAGLKPEHIENAHVCTCCHSEQFFSYRADKGKTGRIAAIISVK